MNIGFDYQHALTSNKLTGNVELMLNNLSNKPLSIEIIDHAYKTNDHKKTVAASGKANLVLNLEKSYGWYDFSIKVTGHNSFEKRYAGRVETGKAGYTDPFMGKVVS
jgi:phospholipase C